MSGIDKAADKLAETVGKLAGHSAGEVLLTAVSLAEMSSALANVYLDAVISAIESQRPRISPPPKPTP